MDSYFLEDNCPHLDRLKDKMKDIDLTNPVVQMYIDEDMMSIVKFWEERCAGGECIMLIRPLHYVNVSVPLKFSQKTSVFTLIIISSP